MSGSLGESIPNGKVVTWRQQKPFETTIYTGGNEYYGARSNEFGKANYEIVTPVANQDENPQGQPSTESEAPAEKN